MKSQLTIILLILFLILSHLTSLPDISTAQALDQPDLASRNYIYDTYPPPSFYPSYPWWLPYQYYQPYQPKKWYEEEFIPAGQLALVVEPVTAEVSIDGYPLPQSKTLSYEMGLLVGRHRVVARAEGYEIYEKEVDIAAAQRLFLTIKLNRRE